MPEVRTLQLCVLEVCALQLGMGQPCEAKVPFRQIDSCCRTPVTSFPSVVVIRQERASPEMGHLKIAACHTPPPAGADIKQVGVQKCGEERSGLLGLAVVTPDQVRVLISGRRFGKKEEYQYAQR